MSKFQVGDRVVATSLDYGYDGLKGIVSDYYDDGYCPYRLVDDERRYLGRFREEELTLDTETSTALDRAKLLAWAEGNAEAARLLVEKIERGDFDE